MKQLIARLIADETGQDLIEYALAAALIGVGAVTAMRGLSSAMKGTFNGVGNGLNNATA